MRRPVYGHQRRTQTLARVDFGYPIPNEVPERFAFTLTGPSNNYWIVNLDAPLATVASCLSPYPCTDAQRR